MSNKPILLSRTQIDAQRWNDHIQQSPQCVIYALSWYLDIVCPDWEALIWPSDAEYAVVMPLPVRHRLGLRILYRPLFCQYLGIFSKQELTSGQCRAFLTAVAESFSYISAYAFNPENYPVLFALGECQGFRFNTLQTHWLDLTPTYHMLHAGYSKDRQANLKRGTKEHWTVTQSDDFEPLIGLFIANHAPSIGRIHKCAYELLREIGKRCRAEDAGTLIYAGLDGKVHAGVLITHYGGRAIYLFNAADKKGRKGCARTVLLDGWFRSHAGTRHIFDFESPGIDCIVSHYRGYGALPVPFYTISRNALPFPLRPMQQIRKWVFKTRRYLSVNLYRILGPSPKNRF